MTGELILTAYTYDQGRVAINNAFSGTAYLSNIEASNISGNTIYSAGTDISSIFATSASTFYNADGTISGNRSTTISGDIIWRKPNTFAGDEFKMLLWNDTDSTKAALYFKCEDHGPSSGISEFQYAKCAIIFSGTGSAGEGQLFICINNQASSTSASTNDVALKFNEDKSAIFYSSVTMNYFVDLVPQASLPAPSIGRVFFSGSPLFRMMVNTGGTSSDWMTLNG